MSNKKRIEQIESTSLVHKTWRGHNREWIFASSENKEAYLHHLNSSLTLKACSLHAFCLMSNHIHEIYQIGDVEHFSRFMRKHHSQFGMFYNRKHDRKGSVSESRPNLELVDTNSEGMIETFYIHANPLRAKIVETVEDLKNYQYSTHLLYGYGIRLPFMRSVILPQWYLRFGDSPESRQQRYLRELENYVLSAPVSQQTFMPNGQIVST